MVAHKAFAFIEAVSVCTMFVRGYFYVGAIVVNGDFFKRRQQFFPDSEVASVFIYDKINDFRCLSRKMQMVMNIKNKTPADNIIRFINENAPFFKIK
jgi:hypothetical protein